MATRTRRIWMVLLSLLFAAACVARVFHFPYRRDALTRAIPPDALWAAEHPSLRDSWRGALENPIVRACLATSGVGDDDIESLLAGRKVDGILGPIAARNTVVAFVPDSREGDLGGPEWTVATWVGYRDPFLRWRSLGRAMGRTAVRQNLKPGVDMWIKALPHNGEHLFLSACVMRGALYACVSRDPSGVRHIALRVNRDPSTGFPDQPPGTPVHHGWLSASALTNRSFDRGNRLRYAIESVDAGGLAGNLELPTTIPGIRPVPMPGGWEPVAALFGNRPSAFAALNKDQAGAALQALTGVAPDFLAPLLGSTADGAPAFVCMLSGRHSGSVMGLKFPGLVAGCRTDMAASDLRARVSESLDILNKRKRLGWIPRLVKDGEYEWVRIESTSGGIFASLREGESPAVAVRNGWLLVASSENVLRDVLDGVPGRTEPEWMSVLKPGSFAPAAWFDAEPACRSMRDAVAVLTLAVIAGSKEPREGSLDRRKLDMARAWLQHAQGAGKCRLAFEPALPNVLVRVSCSVDSN